LFGETLGVLSGKPPPHAEGFLPAFQAALSGAGLRMAIGPLRRVLPSKKWREAITITHRFADHYIDLGLKYREKLLAKQLDSNEVKKSNILLYNMVEETEDRVFLRNQILQGMIASEDTTSSLLGNVFFLLARHPDVWHKLRVEVLAAGNALDYNSLTGMSYMQKVLKEGTIVTILR
jgi:cytochrome P450